MSTLGLVLSGGGARAAYQAGVLMALSDICAEMKIEQPFQIYSGVSAGAINAAVVTSYDGNFSQACQHLNKLWNNIKSEDVYVSNPMSLTQEGIHWLLDLSLGGMKRSTPGKSLLNTAPLRSLIEKYCTFENIEKKIRQNDIQALAITAMDYFNTYSITFVEAHKDIPIWERARRKSERANISADHLMASSAIPLLFPPINLGEGFFGDGSIRNLSPLSPVIYMGAERVLAVGVRSPRELCYSQKSEALNEPPTVARILSVMLNA
ncbi:MAG TPA: patatin-like phospholipase family protein, partial [Bdellovibrio sp.]|nr:patatin-like phospholipase family protein [Bdellovibrio sp.]